MAHHWPWCSPWAVWRLDLGEWLLFAKQADVELAAIRKSNERR